MINNKAILVPVDFTEAARHAMVNAIDLGKKLGSEIYVVNFIPPFTSKITDRSGTTVKNKSGELASYINLLKENQKNLADMLQTIPDHEVTIHSEIKMDKISSGIRKQLKIKDIELVVIGIADAHTIGDAFCKIRPAHHLIELDCPIMICNNQYNNENGYDSIVVSVDFNAPDQQNIEKLAAITNSLSLRVHYIHINHPSDERRFSKAEIASYIKQHKLHSDSIKVVDSSYKEEAIRNYANEQGANFIAINKFNKTYNYEVCHAERVVQETQSPVFVY